MRLLPLAGKEQELPEPMTAAAACVHTARLLPEAPTRDLVPLFAERRLAALPADHRLAQRTSLSTADLVDEPHLRYLQTAPVPGVSGLSAGCAASRRKLEHVAAGHGIIVLPLSATRYYSRTDVVYVPVVDAELDQVYLACDGTRRSKLISGFVQVAQQASALRRPRGEDQGERGGCEQPPSRGGSAGRE